MKKSWLLIFFLALFSSCELYEDVEVIDIGKIKLEKMEGNNAQINVAIQLNNTNWFGIKVKPSSLEVYIEDEFVGEAFLIEKEKIKPKKTAEYKAQVELRGTEGVLKKVIKYSLKKELKIRLKGIVKGSVMGITKKVAVDKTQTYDAVKFRMAIPFMN